MGRAIRSLRQGRTFLVVGALIGALVLAGLVAAFSRGEPLVAAQSTTPPPGATIPVEVLAAQPVDMQQTTTLTGEFQPQEHVQVASRISARITKLPVDVGQMVAAGAVLVELDRSTLEASLQQAQAQAAGAQANLKKIESGARDEDVAAARAAAQQAAERLDQAQAQAGAVRNQDLAQAQAGVEAAEARLRQVTQGPTEADLANAEAALRGAQARYDQLANGARPEDIDVAVQALKQQQDARAKLASTMASAKEQARIGVEQAASGLRTAQANYGSARLIYEQAVSTMKDPNISDDACKVTVGGKTTKTDCNSLTDAKLRQYKAAFEQAEQALRQAEAGLAASQVAYEDAKKQEITALQQQDAAVQSAQAQLDKLKAGATAEDLAAAQSQVDQAQAALDKLRQPAREADVAAAQAQVTQAQAALDKLRAAPSEVGVAQAGLEQAQAQALKAADPYLPADLEAAQAQVLVAEAGVKAAEVALRDATITAPFDGVISARNVSEGALAAPGTVLLELVSTDVRGVFNVEEAQVGLIQLGQKATLNTSAYPGEQFEGIVSTINPTANASTRSFGVKITPQTPAGKLKAGMFAQATLVTASKQGALAVPQDAVVARDGKSYIFIIVDSKAQQREVSTGLISDGKVEITSGLQAGEQVVVTGQNLLNDGDAVSVQP